MPEYDFRAPRLFVDAALSPGERIALEREQSNYLGNVLRLSGGDTILVFNGRDGEWQASIAGRKRPDQLSIVAQRPVDPKATDFDWGFKFEGMYGTDARYTHFLGELDTSIHDRTQLDIRIKDTEEDVADMPAGRQRDRLSRRLEQLRQLQTALAS